MNTMNKLMRLAGAALCASLLLTACGGGSDDLPAGVVADRFETLSEGQYIAFSLPKATYTIEVSANNHGVVVSWVNGSGCTTSAERLVYAATCTLAGDGQVIVTNPTTFGLGGAETVTIKVTRL